MSLESLESRQLLTLAVPSLSKVHAAIPVIAPTAHVSTAHVATQNHHFQAPRLGFATRANLVFNRFDPSNGLRTAKPLTGTAGFVGADTTTAGTWSPTYGAGGYVLTNGVASTPSYATVTPSGQGSYTWSGSTTDSRGLLTAPAAATRRADTWYGQSFSIDVNLTDGKTHNVSFYAVDWESSYRSERFDVVDPSTNTVLDSRTISSFHGGQYLTWALSGHVQVQVTNLTGDNAVVSGVFFAASAVQPVGNPVSGPYSPAQMRHAYGVDQLSQDGTGQTIAIIDAFDSPTAISDFDTFSRAYGLPTGKLIKATPQGVPMYNSGWATEIALDVEWAHVMAPNATILLVEAKSNSFDDLLGAVDYAVAQGAKQVSMSFGGRDFAGESNYDFHFNHPGVTFFASAGDSGTEAEYPAASPYVVSVGGTLISLDAAGNKISETSWTGSGGAMSLNESKPSYQNGFFNGSGRGIPDVAYNADPGSSVPIFVNGAWGSVGGTSAGAPQWAGIMALVNQGRAAIGKSSIGTGTTFGTNEALYALAGGSSYTNAGGNFYDVTTGGNGLNAGVGYDFVTGLGSPVANKLVPNLIKF